MTEYTHGFAPFTEISDVGITGTRNGGSMVQELIAYSLLRVWKQMGAGIFHHGDCIGVDVDLAAYAYDLGYQIIAHPPELKKTRGFFKHNHVTREPKEYHTRDRDIVNESQVLLALPYTEEDERSGTWTTIRFARQAKRRHVIVRRNGVTEVHDPAAGFTATLEVSNLTGGDPSNY